ncbi:MAG TPA: hypothetical protein VNM36_08645, partial [Gemmatimonadaceae bacterium]|nr:hypothetical protein [Gemmatimonadaceae bacterium]
MSVHTGVRRSLVAAALMLASGLASGQVPRMNVDATLTRADSAYARGDRERARALYAEVLANDSTQSRAVFRLAQLTESGERALMLYRRYIA